MTSLLKVLNMINYNMIELFLHLVGICPDSISHIDFLDIIYANHNKLHVYTAYIKVILNF